MLNNLEFVCEKKHQVSFKVKKNLYPYEVLMKASFSFLNRTYIHLDEETENWIVKLTSKDNSSSIESSLIKEFESELIAQAVRYNVMMKTHNIRELLLARAMTSTMVDEMDPFQKIENDSKNELPAELTDVLSDWFERYE